MIYEVLEQTFDTLADQWQELSDRLADLAASVDPTSPSKAVIQGWSASAISLGKNQATGWKPPNANTLPLSTLLGIAINVIRPLRDVRNNIDSGFTTLVAGSPMDGGLVSLCEMSFDQLKEYISNALQEFEEITTVEGERYNLSRIRNSVDNISSYPVLTSDISYSPSPSSGSGGSSSTGIVPLQRIVDGAMRDVIGRVPKSKDTKSFVSALSQSFELKQIEGHVEFTWTARSYAGQTDLAGGVTGGQASLYTRAKLALDNSLPLLDGLYPLLPDADLEEVDAVRSIVRTEWQALVQELSAEGGPRIQRVETLFKMLLVDATVGLKGNVVLNGKLGYLEEVFGLRSGYVNTLIEETNFTNFIAFKDYITSIQASWNVFQTQMLGKDLGTRLVLLSRALSVSAETVDEVYAAMDSVFVGPAERQVAAFRDSSKRDMLVEDVLSWVQMFASEEAPTLVREGGRRGVGAIISTAQTLETLLYDFITALPIDPRLPEGLRHPRVRNPLEELRSYLGQVVTYANAVQKP